MKMTLSLIFSLLVFGCRKDSVEGKMERLKLSGDFHTGFPVEVTYGLTGDIQQETVSVIVIGQSVGVRELEELLDKYDCCAGRDCTLVVFPNYSPVVTVRLGLQNKLGAKLSSLKTGSPSEVMGKLGM